MTNMLPRERDGHYEPRLGRWWQDIDAIELDMIMTNMLPGQRDGPDEHGEAGGDDVRDPRLGMVARHDAVDKVTVG